MSTFDEMMSRPAACLGCGRAVPRTSILADHWCCSCQGARTTVRRLVRWATDEHYHQVAEDPAEALVALFAARVALEQTTRYVVRDALASGATWKEIGGPLHLEPKAAKDRYGPPGG